MVHTKPVWVLFLALWGLAMVGPSWSAEDEEAVADTTTSFPTVIEAGDDGAEEDTDEEIQIDPISGKRMYHQFQLFSVQPQSEEQLSALRFISKGVQDLWTPIPLNLTEGVSIDMLVGPKHEPHVSQFLNCSGIPYNIRIVDIQRAIEEENEIDESATRIASSALLRSKRGTTFGDILRNMFGLDTSSPQSRPGMHPSQVELVRHGRDYNSKGTPRPYVKNSLDPTPSPIYYKPAPIRGIPPSSPSQQPGRTNRQGPCVSEARITWDQYHRADKIMDYLSCLARRYSNMVTIHDLGRTVNGQPLKVIEVAQSQGGVKPSIWLDGGIHAREWISPAAVTYMLSELVENSESHTDVLSKFNFFIMPVMNPDGYEYTHTHDRLWRKTRSRTYHQTCHGTDPNRNWGYEFGGKGASTDPCSETYRGPNAFSERETKAVSNFILSRAHNMKMYLTFHSYGQYILYPWGYTADDEPSNWRDLQRVGEIAGRAMQRQQGRKYTVGSAAKLLYPAAGGSDDWAKGAAGIEYSFTIELPDAGRYGFLLPAKQILSVSQEALVGVKAMANAI